MVFLCHLNQAEQDRTDLGRFCGIGEREVVALDHERLISPFQTVIAELNVAVLQIGRQRRPLVLKVVQSNAPLRLWRGGSRF